MTDNTNQVTLETDYMSFIHTSRYSKWLNDLGRRESWAETVDRYMDNIVHPVIDDISLREEIRQEFITTGIAPSMRSVMTAGKASKRDNTCMYNCAYTTVDNILAFDEAMFILLCGTGVGFSVERQYVSKLPRVPDEFTKRDDAIIVGDSKEGWAKALRKLIKALYDGELSNWDTSGVRPAGAKLKTFGGRASGPAPLIDLFNFVTAVFTSAKGRKLSSLECHDIMCKIGEVVVVGGVRRSAMISLSNLSDDRMRHAKSGSWWENNPQRALANNSVAYTEKPDAMSFMREWTALVESGSGERGVFNREASVKQAGKNGRRKVDYEFGTNPCCFTGDMELLTEEGYMKFSDLAGEDSVSIVNHNGDITKGKVWFTEEKDTVFVNYEAGLGRDPIQVTPDHVFMLVDGTECEAGELAGKQPMPYIKQATFTPNDFFLGGFMLGDDSLNRLSSTTHKGLEVYFSEKDYEVAKAYNKPVGSWYSTKAFIVANTLGLPSVKIGYRGLPVALRNTLGLQGLYSANGSVIKGSRVALKSIDKTQIKHVQDVLTKLGITSNITTNKPKVNRFGNGEYTMKESYDLNIGRYDSIVLFAELIGFAQGYKQESLKELLLVRAPTVKFVKPAPKAPVYDFSEPITNWGVVNGVVVHNSEIILRPQQFCNLSEIVVRKEDTFDDLKRKVRLATILGTIQSTYTHFPYLRKVWKDNTDEERLLGVSLTGIMDNPMTSATDEFAEEYSTALTTVLSTLKQVAVDTNKEWADKLGIPQSTAITCVKPSGTVSQLVDSASGIHARHSEYYIRTVRGDNKDPVTQFMIDQGIPNEPDVMKPDATTVFSFPQKSPEGAITRNDMTAIQQLELWLTYQRHWCEHKPSVTVTVRDEEWLEVGAYVYKYFDEMSGVSFLPHSDHTYQQAPYQECTVAEYETMMLTMPESIDWSLLSSYESEDNTVGTQTFACVGSCEIVDLT